jgi:hypothetical protein
MERHAMADQLENMVKLSSMRYVVWTQAGFKKAIKAVNDDHQEVKGHPVKYPSLVTFHDAYAGYHYLNATCTPLGEAIEEQRKLLDRLIEIDGNHKMSTSGLRP